MAKAVVNPEAELPPRPGDAELNEDLLGVFGVFASMKKSPAFAKFPGTCVLRHYQAGEAICSQGDSGGTAFYLLTSADIAALQQRCEEGTKDGKDRKLAEFHNLLRSVSWNQEPASADSAQPRRLATARLMMNLPAQPTVGSRSKQSNAAAAPLMIANDGPTDIDYETKKAPIFEGEVFGEMSCLTRQPRSATVVADCECLVLEFLRNILEQMRKDPKYNEEAERKYRERVLEGHLRQLSIFRHLEAEEFDRVRERIELVQFAPDTVLWDEGDPSDAMYVVRSGIVQVLQSYPWPLAEKSVSSWPKLWAALKSAPSGSAVERVRKSLSASLQEALAAADEPSDDNRTALLNELNALAKGKELLDAKEVQSVLSDPRMKRESAAFPPKVKSWTGMQLRRGTRTLYYILFPDAIHPPEPVGLARVLHYVSRGSILGEIGVMRDKPRTATCIAYSHPDPDRESTNVELVRVPAEMVHELERKYPEVRKEIGDLIQVREKRSVASPQTPIGALSQSKRIDDLGLLQGQNLMLIDLDRCTRCGDCVQACISTHDDGYSRLFLDGPRFGKYLIPSSCRQCRDPVCMIGCPVSSIQQGDDGEIRIREWCVGCKLCATQCPYDSIQMHDAALLPTGVISSWLVAATAPDAKWHQLTYSDAKWQVGTTPLNWGLAMHLAMPTNGSAAVGPKRLYFRARFRTVGPGQTRAERHRLLITSQGADVQAFLNGQPLALTQDAPQKKRFQYACELHGDAVRDGDNVLAISCGIPGEFNATAIDARIDALAPESAEVEEKLVQERAVVCDQCSSLSGDRNACVYACPHEAAMRIDTWVSFPTG